MYTNIPGFRFVFKIFAFLCFGQKVALASLEVLRIAVGLACLFSLWLTQLPGQPLLPNPPAKFYEVRDLLLRTVERRFVLSLLCWPSPFV